MTQPPPRTRMTAEQRQHAIALAAIPVFASKGFAATTTKDLARAAGVSEALLYRHFPSKESLHHHIQEQICESNSALQDFVCSLEPGSRSVVTLVYLIFKIIIGSKNEHPIGNAIPRLMVQSLLEDGEFAHSFNLPRFARMVEIMQAACTKAAEDGDLVKTPLHDYEKMWFPHHLAMALRLADMPPTNIFDYGAPDHQRIFNASWFALRGIGMRDDVIETFLITQHLDPIIDDVLWKAGMRQSPPKSSR